MGPTTWAASWAAETAHHWCPGLLGREACRLRGSPPRFLPAAGPLFEVGYLGMQAGLELPSGHMLTILRHHRPAFGGVQPLGPGGIDAGPPLPPRAVHPFDFLYKAEGEPAVTHSLGLVKEFLGLFNDPLRAADMLWAGQCSTAALFSLEVRTFLEELASQLRAINMQQWAEKQARALEERASAGSSPAWKAARRGPR